MASGDPGLGPADERSQRAIRQFEEHRRWAEEEMPALIERVHEVADEVNRASPRTSWQANSSGLSGRILRGFRHWRYKR